MDTKKRMSRNFIVFFVLFLSSSWLIAQESKVRVVVDSARIYAEASTESYRIETIKKGTVLSLFGTNQALENWLYVYYQSPRWNSKVTGFIQAEMVEEFSARKLLIIGLINQKAHDEKVIARFEGLFLNLAEEAGNRIRVTKGGKEEYIRFYVGDKFYMDQTEAMSIEDVTSAEEGNSA